MPKTLVLYKTHRGKCPFTEWLLALKDSRARAKIRARLERLQLGNLGDCKGVGQGVMELRVPYGPGYRVYFGIEGETLVILLCGGNKSTQPEDINTAKRYWQEYHDAH